MQQKIGIVKNIKGQFKTVDKDGNIRILKNGDFIYEGDEVSSIHEQDGGLSDALNTTIPSGDYFILIQDLRTSEEYLVRQGGYRYFDIQDMGNDETSIGHQIFSTEQTSDIPDGDHGTESSSDNGLVGPQVFLANPIHSGLPASILPDDAAESEPTIEPATDPESEPDSGSEPELNQAPVFISGETTGRVIEIADNAPGENSIRHTTSGILNIMDADASDTHTVTSSPSDLGYVGVFTPTIDTASGTITWEFTVPDADIDHLKEGETLTQTYTITVDDGNGGTATKDVTVTIEGKNDAPNAKADTGNVTEDSPAATGNVLTNDSDVDGDDLTISKVNGVDPANGVNTNYGTITITPDGSYTYTADTAHPDVSRLGGGETLTDTITYTVNDGNGGSTTQTLTITITGTNDAPNIVAGDITGSVTEIADNAPGENMTSHIAQGTLGVTDADTSDTHTVTAEPSATGYVGVFTPTIDTESGTITWEFTVPDADIDHLKDGQTVTQTYTVKVDDGKGGIATQDVTITINGKNDGPDAKADSIAVKGENAEGNVLTNDEDVDGDALSVTGFTVDGMNDDNGVPIVFSAGMTAHTIEKDGQVIGTLMMNTDGKFTFIGSNDFHGTVPDITYTVKDAHEATDSALLQISVLDNNAPLIDLNSAATGTDPDTAWAAEFTEDGPAISIAGPDTGINTNGGGQIHEATITLTNTKAGDVLDYTAIEASGLFIVTKTESGDDTILTITPLGGADRPKEDFEDAIKAITFSNTSDNPDLEDRIIKVQVEDSNSESNIAVSTITMTPANDVPTITSNADAAAGTVMESGHEDSGTPTAGVPVVSKTLTASDPDDNDTQTWSVTGTGNYGSIAIDPDTGTWTYTLNNDLSATQALREGERRTETFTATVTDSAGVTADQPITVTINGANDKPTITSTETDAKGVVTEDAANNTATGTLASSDVDNNDTGTWSMQGPTTGTYGAIAIDPATGQWTYTLDNSNPDTQALKAGETRTETFTALVTDEFGATAEQAITVTVTGVNDAPVVDLDGTASGTGYDYTVLDTQINAGVSIAASDMDVSDVDTEHLQTLTITLNNPQLGDVLDISGVDPSAFEKVESSNDGYTLTLAPKANMTPGHDAFEAAIKAVKLKNPNTENDLDDTPRTITVTVNDGTLDSNTATATIKIDRLPTVHDDATTVTENKDGSIEQSVTGNLLDNDYPGDNRPDAPTTLHEIVYKDNGGNNQTVEITADNTSIDTQYGTLVVSRDGSYTYTPDANLTHTDGNDLQEIFTYTIKDHDMAGTADDDVSGPATMTIAIKDGVGPTISNASVDVYEQHLPLGSDPDNNELTQSGTFVVGKGSDDVDVTFMYQTNPDGTIPNDQLPDVLRDLKSNETGLTYTISNDGHTLTAIKAGTTNQVFTVTITTPGASAGYEFVLKGSLDANGTQDVINLPFKVGAVDDDDGDTAEATLTVTVHDDNPPSTKAITVTEDSREGASGNSFNTNADANRTNTHIGSDTSEDGHWVDTQHGRAHVNSDGSISYEPNANYSGTDTFTYTTTAEGDGSGKTVTVTVTVDPESDAPTMGSNYRTNTVNEDDIVALGSGPDASEWKLPTITDHTDQNGAGVEGDWPERMGLLSLSGLPDGATVYKADGTTLVFTSDGSNPMRIRITGKEGYHTKGAIEDTSATIVELTEEEFNGLKIKPPANSSADMTLTLKATEYEVDGTGTIYQLNGSDIAGVESTQTITVPVDPVTDTSFTLTKGTVPSGNEDEPISLKTAFNFAQSADTDGSEHYTLNFSSDNALDHVRFKFPGQGWQTLDEFNLSDHFFTGNTFPDVKIKTLDHDSRDIKGLKLTLTPQDYDQDHPNDSAQAATAGTPQSITLDDIIITPVANDATLSSTGANGNEDTKIAMGLGFTNNDAAGDAGQEVVDHLVIRGIPTGVKIYSGDTVVFTGDGNKEFDTANPEAGLALTQADIESLTILPTQDFSGDINLGVKVYSKDTDDDSGDDTQVTTLNPTEVAYTITVKGVVDTSSPASGVDQWVEGGHEAENTGRLYVKINDTLTQENQEVIISGQDVDNDPVKEDEAVNLGLSWNTYENQQHTTTDGSETAEFIIRNQVGDTTSFTLEDGNGNAIGTKVNGGWKLTANELSQAHVKAQKDFSGDLKLALVTKVTDGSDVNEQTDNFTVSLAPVTDVPTLQLTNLYATEDTKTKFDIYPQLSDVDGSEQVTKVVLTDIPPGVTLYIKNGNTYDLVTISGDTHTFTIDDSATPAGNTITTDQLKNIYIQAPPDFNGNFKVKVLPYVQDPDGGAEVTLEDGQPQTVTVYVKGDADTPVRTDRTNSDTDPKILTIDELQPNDDVSDNLVKISSLGYQSGETINPSDHSETLSYVLHDLPNAFQPVNTAGVSIGSFIGTNAAGEVSWSFTQEEMDVLHIKVPDYYSGTTNLELEAIAVENDGDTATVSRTFDLVIKPVISTTKPVDPQTYTIKEPVTAHGQGSVGNDDDTTPDTFVRLKFNILDDETVTKVQVHKNSLPDGVFLGTVDDQGNLTPANLNQNIYTIENNIENLVVILKGVGSGTSSAQTNTNDGILLAINNINVSLKDAIDDGSSGFSARTTINQSVKLIVEARADQPDITKLEVTQASGGTSYNTVKVTTDFPDDDGSESHYYIVKTLDNDGNTMTDVWLNEGVYQGNGTWYLTTNDMADGFEASFRWTAADERQLSITAYADENTLAKESVIGTIVGHANGAGPDNGLVAQAPQLTLVNELPTPDEDTSFTLADVVDEAFTRNQDTDGNETLSFVITGLDMNNIESVEGMTPYFYDDGNGEKKAYRIDIGTEPDEAAIRTALEEVRIIPKENFSGDIRFNLQAIAEEPSAAIGNRSSSVSQDVTITIKPVAEAVLVVTPEVGLADAVEENSITLVKLALSNGDDSNPETISNIMLTLGNGQGAFVDDEGNVLGQNLTAANGLTYDANSHTFTYDSEPVYYMPPEYEGGTFTIGVTADMTDAIPGYNNTNNVSADVTVTVTPMPSDGDLILHDGHGNPINDGTLTVKEDELKQLNIHDESFKDGDNSEFQTVLIENVPAGMLFYSDKDGTQLVGEITEVVSGGKNTWKLPVDVMDGHLYIKPPLHYTQDIALTVKGVAMESENMGSQQNHEASFTLHITPVANGATIFPQTAEGNANVPFKVNLGAKFVADEERHKVGLDHEIEETYNLTFKNVREDITLYYEDEDGLHTLPNTDALGTHYAVTGLTQPQMDSLHARVGDGETGAFTFKIEVSTSESEGDSTSGVTEGTLNVEIGPATGVKTMTIDGTNTIFGTSRDDTGIGTTAKDIIYGGEGDDTIVFDTNDTRIDGGVGEDTLNVADPSVNFTNLANDLIVDMEVIDLKGNGAQDVTFDADSVKNMTDADNTLLVRGDGSDEVHASGWTATGTDVIENVTYTILDNNGATLKVEQGVNYNIA